MEPGGEGREGEGAKQALIEGLNNGFFAWLLLGNILHFVSLWFSGGNPHLTANIYIYIIYIYIYYFFCPPSNVSQVWAPSPSPPLPPQPQGWAASGPPALARRSWAAASCASHLRPWLCSCGPPRTTPRPEVGRRLLGFLDLKSSEATSLPFFCPALFEFLNFLWLGWL